MGDGGYLIWRLWPEYLVMSDGRLEVFGPELLLQFEFRDVEALAALDARYRFGTVLLNHRRTDVGELAAWLHASPEWRLAYLDDVSVAFVREGAEGGPWPELQLDAPDLFAPLEGVLDIPARERLTARTRVLRNLGRPDVALREWEELLRRFPETPDGRRIRRALRVEAAARIAPVERSDDPGAGGARLAPAIP
jgi:hypothetical protein